MLIPRRSRDDSSDDPPEPNGRAGRRARSRRRILDAASAALTEGEQAPFTVRDIAARAQVSPGLVMQHFGTMADLVLEVFTEANADLDAQLAAAAAPGRSVRERILSSFAWLMARDLSRPRLSGRLMAYAWTWSDACEERFEPSVRALTTRIVELLEDGASSPPDVAREAAATALIAVYNVNLRRAVTAGCSVDDAMARMTPSVDLVLAGLAAAEH